VGLDRTEKIDCHFIRSFYRVDWLAHDARQVAAGGFLDVRPNRDAIDVATAT
jgi:hypothetical protein